MPFPEPIKLEAKKRANFKCCVCQTEFVEVHHIKPQAEGGSDDIKNAAPLCAGCHKKYGGNPELRKQLREMRDHWWEKCSPQLCQDASSEHFDEAENDTLAETTLYKYQKTPLSQEYLAEAINFLEDRYKPYKALAYNQNKFPITVLWQNKEEIIDPDDLCGGLDSTPAIPLCDDTQRDYIKKNLERGKVKRERKNFCMKQIDDSKVIPKIHAGLGLYYDNILTQYAIEWELNRLGQQSDSVEELREKLLIQKNLPRRMKAEKGAGAPFKNGTARCAAITVSMMFVLRREKDYYYLVRKRSEQVAVSPGMWHVAPAGMCEATHNEPRKEWSFKHNLYREFLEELYDKEQLIDEEIALPEDIYRIEPLKTLEGLVKKKEARFTVTGICADLLTLRTEVCTVLVVDSEKFSPDDKIELCWEYKTDRDSPLLEPLLECDDFLAKNLSPDKTVSSGAACLILGLDWLRYHGYCK